MESSTGEHLAKNSDDNSLSSLATEMIDNYAKDGGPGGVVLHTVFNMILCGTFLFGKIQRSYSQISLK